MKYMPITYPVAVLKAARVALSALNAKGAPNRSFMVNRYVTGDELASASRRSRNSRSIWIRSSLKL